MVCRVCGCSYFDACVYSNGAMEFTCWWAEPGLCSFCVLKHRADPGASIVVGGHRAVVVLDVSGGLL